MIKIIKKSLWFLFWLTALFGFLITLMTIFSFIIDAVCIKDMTDKGHFKEDAEEICYIT
jgi:hypothetical protein